MTRQGTQDTPVLSNEKSQEEAPQPRLSANAELAELGQRLEHQYLGFWLADHNALLGRLDRAGFARHVEKELRRSCCGSQEPLLKSGLLNHSCNLHNVPHIIMTSVRARFSRCGCASERAKE